jgi:hypothetical protein
VWHPAQRCENSTAPANVGSFFGTLIFCVPQATVNTATAAAALSMRRTLVGRLMRAEIIRKSRGPYPRHRCRWTGGYDRLVSAVRARKLALVVVSLAVGWVAAACGRTQAVGSDRTVQMSVTEYHLSPQSVRANGGVLSIIVHNDGRLTHNLVVSSDGQSVAGTKPIPPGETAELSLDLAPGKYLMASTIQSDQTLGAYGTLMVG